MTVARGLVLAASLATLGMPLSAQTRPSPPQIMAALVATASTVAVVDDNGTALPQGSAVGILTLMLHELGFVAPQSEDQIALHAACDPHADGWDCTLSLSIHWDDAESAMITRFVLEPGASPPCAPQSFQMFSDVDPCAWGIKDQRITYFIAG